KLLTMEPTKLTQADADAVFAAGWDEVALHHAIAVAARYNLVNRLIHGHGVEANPDTFKERGERIAAKTADDWKDNETYLAEDRARR
ncbi:MAG: peroxidase, partial [Alphaproteobacteria bacterium]|nr:peroxidase [Alphaproteobacteria bacterium]